MPDWWRKASGWLHRDTIEAELREEMGNHLEMKASATGDVDNARRQFGNVTLLTEDSRAEWGWPQVESWLRDLQFAFRGVARNPGFAAAVILTLALGIGASSTVYSLVDTILIRPLPYPDSDRLVAIQEAKPADPNSRTPVAAARLEDWHRLNGTFEAIGGSHFEPLIESSGPVPERLSGAFVSPRFFAVIGVSPALGRVFTEQEERFGGPLAVVISDGLWRRRFAADPGVLGRSLIMSGRNYVIVGRHACRVSIPGCRN